MPRMTLKSTISNSTRSVEVSFKETMTGQFLYTRLDISGSPSGVETEKGSVSVSGVRINLTSIPSYKSQKHLFFLSTK